MALLISGIILVVIGILCCFINKVPGPIVAFVGMLLFKFSPMGTLLAWWIVILCGVIAVASIFIIRMLVPIVKAKVPAYGKGGTWGTVVGSLLAVLISLGVDHWIVAVILLLALPYAFAFIFELVSQKNATKALKSSLGASAIFGVTTLIKLIICVFMLYSGMNLMAKDVEKKATDTVQKATEAADQLKDAANKMQELGSDIQDKYNGAKDNFSNFEESFNSTIEETSSSSSSDDWGSSYSEETTSSYEEPYIPPYESYESDWD